MDNFFMFTVFQLYLSIWRVSNIAYEYIFLSYCTLSYAEGKRGENKRDVENFVNALPTFVLYMT